MRLRYFEMARFSRQRSVTASFVYLSITWWERKEREGEKEKEEKENE